MNTEMTKCWPWAHHWHYVETITTRTTDAEWNACPGTREPVFRCCRCRCQRLGYPNSRVGADLPHPGIRDT